MTFQVYASYSTETFVNASGHIETGIRKVNFLVYHCLRVLNQGPKTLK